MEKRRNAPETIYFQHYEIDGFFAPKFIYVAFSPDSKTEYKAQSRLDLAEFINRSLNSIQFLQHETNSKTNKNEVSVQNDNGRSYKN